MFVCGLACFYPKCYSKSMILGDKKKKKARLLED